VLNFAQAETGTFAAFLLWELVHLGLPWVVSLLLALLAVAVLGLAFERLVMRPLVHAPRMTLVVATIAGGLFLGGFELNKFGASPRITPTPFHGGGLHISSVILTPPRLLALVITAVIAFASAWFFRRTTFGLGLLAAAQDSVGVRLTGLRLRHLSAFTWAVSAVVGGLAGILIAMSLGAFAPFSMSAGIMLFGFAAAVLGGMTSLPGALIGGITVGVAKAIVSHYWISVPGLVETLMFAAIVVVLLVRPQGLLGRAA
jgi:branched-chain amino acid transport system permease protein